MKPYLSIVIPAYNEAKNFRAGLLKPAVEYLKKQKYNYEVLFVDDGSTDDTNNLLSDFIKKNRDYKLIKIPHGGKAAAVTAGMMSATGEIILFTDFDQSTPITQTAKFLEAHKKGADVVIGSRGLSSETKDDTVFRKIRSKLFVLLVQVVLLPGIRDTQCGFKSFTQAAAKKIFSSLLVTNSGKVTGGYMGAFDVEALFLARKYGYKIDQVPVEWVKIISDRLNFWKEPLQMAIDTFKVRYYDLMRKYDHNPNTT